MGGRSNAESRARAFELLQALDVAHWARAETSELFGGEQQRTHNPLVLSSTPRMATNQINGLGSNL